MCLFLVLFWCSAVVRRYGGPNISADNSRFGEFNSRLGRPEFPVCAATGIRSQALDLAHRSRSQIAVVWAKSTTFPVSTGKTGNLAPIGGTGRLAPERDRLCYPPSSLGMKKISQPSRIGWK